MSIESTDKLIEQGHQEWKRGNISKAFALQAAAQSERRRIERECDYKIVLTGHGMGVVAERDRIKHEKMYQEAWAKYSNQLINKEPPNGVKE